MSDQNIRPCPFCGGPASLEQGGGRDNLAWSVGCDARNEDACPGHQSLTVFARQCDAIRAWNRREADARLADAAAQIEALRAGRAQE